MTAFPDLNRSDDPDCERALQKASDNIQRLLKGVKASADIVRPPTEYWDTRKSLGTRRKDN